MIWGRMKMMISVRCTERVLRERMSSSSGMRSRKGRPVRARSSRSLIKPPSSTVWELATAIELLTLRWETVGVSVVALALGATLLISCSISSSTLPLTLIRGRTRRMTPVLR